MPVHESLSVKVALIVEVDGHRLEFPATVKASGARYHGREAPAHFRTDSVLEREIRDGADTAIALVRDAATEFLARAYPYAGEPGEAKP